ncbi:hypothetical protein AAK899_08740 [Erysipelotrichaceae bacterium 51-3]
MIDALTMAADQADMNCHPARTGLKPKEAEEIRMTCKIIEEVKEEERAVFAGRLLEESEWSIEKIARIANLPVEEVQQLQAAQIASTGGRPVEIVDQ